MNVHWKDWCWTWNSNTLATWCEELTHLKIPWCWEWLKVGEVDERGWDGWMASPTQRTWVWVNSGSWWWTGSPGMLQSLGMQRVGLNWVTELNWNSRENPSVAFSNLLCHKTGSRHHLSLHLISLHSKSSLSVSSTPEKAIWLHSRTGSLLQWLREWSLLPTDLGSIPSSAIYQLYDLGKGLLNLFETLNETM